MLAHLDVAFDQLFVEQLLGAVVHIVAGSTGQFLHANIMIYAIVW